MIFSMRPGQVFRKHCLIALRRLEVFGLKFASLRYCSSSGLVVFNRFLFATISSFLYPGELPIFQFAFYWFLLLSVVFFNRNFLLV